jgi:nicotinate-nucleotide adenylyltransferase
MAALAIGGKPAWRLSDLELRGDAPSYTATTLQQFHQRGCPPSELYFVIGADAFADIASWRAPVDPPSPDGPSVILIDARTADVSSTAIRTRRAEGRPIGKLVDAAVEHHIEQHGLYAPAIPDRRGND